MKAEEFAGKEFPCEKWIFVEEGIHLSPRRPIGEKLNYRDELRDAQILKDLGGTIYLCPENRYIQGRKYDAVVNGLKIEFKNMTGMSVKTLKDHFLRSRKQAPNVFINLEKSPLTKRDIINTLYRARNSEDYAKKNQFNGGRIILKSKGQTNLIYLNVDDLKVPGQ